MNKVLNVKVDQKVKTKAKKIAADLGLTLSGVINAYLRQFVRSGTLFVSTGFEEPSDFLRETIRQAEADRSKNKQISFAKSQDALDFLDKMISSKKTAK